MKSKNDGSLTVRALRALQNSFQFHQILPLPRKMTFGSTSHFNPQLPKFFEPARSTAAAMRMKKVPDVLPCRAKQGSDLPKVMNLARLPAKKTYMLQERTRHAGENATRQARSPGLVGQETSFEKRNRGTFCVRLKLVSPAGSLLRSVS